MSDDIPAGFSPHSKKSGLTAPWEPIYSRLNGDAVSFGLRTGPAHANSRGFVHGGLITALADNAMGMSCGLALPEGANLVTVGLSVDFMASVRLGQWMEIRPVVMKSGQTLSFCVATVYADDMLCARANATFLAARPPGAAAQ
jgi:uncharacterized protein (TIGR00369 family)